MAEIIITLSIIICIIVLVFLNKIIKQKTFNIILKIFNVIFFALFFYRLFSDDAIDGIMNFNGFLQPFPLVLISLIRWFTSVAVLLTLSFNFVDVKTIKNLFSYFVPIVVLLNICFFRLNMIAFTGSDIISFLSARAVIFALELLFMGFLSGFSLYQTIKNKDYANIKIQIKYMAIVLSLLMLAVFPQNLLYNLFGQSNTETKDFVLIHRLIIYIAIGAPILITYFAKNKDYNVRYSITVLLSIAGFMQYFYVFNFNLSVTGLPFHLCNTAIILMVLAFVFKIKSVFYFTYFVNVTGALFAIILPNISSDFFLITNQHFWFNHWYAFFLPLLGITLKIYPRPNFKMIRAAIFIFTLYVLFAVIINSWFSNYGDVDYFFLNKNFIVEKFMFLMPVKNNFVITFNINNLTFNIYWLYTLVVYFFYVFLIFLTWIFYAYFYKVSDHYAQLAAYSKADILEINNLKKELNGRPLSEPLNINEVNMLKITNFSKRYGNNKFDSVKNINFEVHDGEIFGFLGHNGAGKSTTIKSMVGISSITQGSISICGYDIQKQPLEAKKLIGYVSDNHAVYEHLTGREYINYVADLYDVSEEDRKARFDKYVKTFDLSDAIDKEIKSYSHGMKQKVMVVSCLIHNPKVWILDEPLTGLDPVSAFQIKKCIKEHAANGNIVFFSSHIIEVVEKICDRIAIIAKGELKGVYNVAELQKQGIMLEQLFMSFIETK